MSTYSDVTAIVGAVAYVTPVHSVAEDDVTRGAARNRSAVTGIDFNASLGTPIDCDGARSVQFESATSRWCQHGDWRGLRSSNDAAYCPRFHVLSSRTGKHSEKINSGALHDIDLKACLPVPCGRQAGATRRCCARRRTAGARACRDIGERSRYQV